MGLESVIILIESPDQPGVPHAQTACLTRLTFSVQHGPWPTETPELIEHHRCAMGRSPVAVNELNPANLSTLIDHLRDRL